MKNRQHGLHLDLDQLKDGPLVVEVPPMVLGMIDDFWFRYVTDIGLVGPDKGKGGKYLLLPPDHKGDVPQGVYRRRVQRRTILACLFSREGTSVTPAQNSRDRSRTATRGW